MGRWAGCWSASRQSASRSALINKTSSSGKCKYPACHRRFSTRCAGGRWRWQTPPPTPLHTTQYITCPARYSSSHFSRRFRSSSRPPRILNWVSRLLPEMNRSSDLNACIWGTRRWIDPFRHHLVPHQIYFFWQPRKIHEFFNNFPFIFSYCCIRSKIHQITRFFKFIFNEITMKNLISRFKYENGMEFEISSIGKQLFIRLKRI